MEATLSDPKAEPVSPLLKQQTSGEQAVRTKEKEREPSADERVAALKTCFASLTEEYDKQSLALQNSLMALINSNTALSKAAAVDLEEYIACVDKVKGDLCGLVGVMDSIDNNFKDIRALAIKT